MGALLLAAGTFLALFLPGIPGGWWAPLIIAILIPFGLAGMANLFFGATLTSASRRLELYVSGITELALRRMAGL